MSEPSTPQHDEQIANLQAQLAVLKQENRELRSRLQACESSAAMQPHFDDFAVGHRLLEATAQAASALLTTANFDEAVNTALQLIGEVLETDRVVLIETVAATSDSAFPSWRALGYEWNSPGTVPQYLDPEAAQGSYEEIPEIFEPLHQGQTLSFLIEEVSEPFRSAQMAIGVKATHAVPIFIEGQWWGLLGFDDCREAKHRSPAELSVLRIAADCIGSAIQRERLRQATQRTQQALLQAEQARVAELSQVNAALAQANEEIVEREREKSVLLSISEALSRTSDRQALLHVIYQNIRSIFPFYGSGLFIINESENYHELLLEPGLFEYMPPEFYGTTERLPHRGSVAEYMAQDYGILSLSEAIERFSDHPHYPVLQQAGVREFIHGPLFSGEQCIGMLCFNAQAEGTYSEKDLRLFKHIADQVAVTVANILAYEAILEREAKIRESEKRYRTLFKLSNEGIYRFELEPPVSTALPIDEQVDLIYQNYRYAEVNNTFVSMLGLERAEDAIGKSFGDFFVGDSATNREGIRAAVENGYQIRGAEALEMGGDGQQRYILWNTVSDVHDGYVWGGWGMQTDITELKEAQQALLRAAQDRVAELAKTNTALKNSLDRLAANPDLNAFLAHVLLEIIQQFQVELGYLHLYDAESQTLPLHLYINQEQVQRPPEVDIPAAFLQPEIADLPIWETLLQTRQPFVITRENGADYVFRGTYDWQVQNQEHRTGINLLLTLKDKPIGLLALVSTRRSFSPEELELAQALAHQATLALQLTRLAEEAKQAAIAREQEQAAQERAVMLEQANIGLQRSIERLSAATDPRAVIVETLRTAAEVLSPLGVSGIGLIRYQPKTRTVQVMVHILNDVEQMIAGSDLDGDWSVDSPAFIVPWQRIQSEDFVWGLTTDTSVLVAEVRHYHESKGTRAIAYVPLRRGEETTGWIGFDLASETPPTPQQIEMIRMLTGQVVLAEEMERLAEAAKQAAIAREQEKAAQERAAELAKANEALRRTVDRLANEPQLESFLSYVLLEACNQLDASAGHLTIYKADQRSLTTAAHVSDGQILPVDFPEEFQLGSYCFFDLLVAERRPRAFDLETEAHLFWPGTIEFHRKCGHVYVFAVPILLDSQPYGHIGLAFRRPNDLVEEQCELLQALSNQAALAIQLTRLAEAAKQAAIAREQEKAAQERAAELAKANTALRQSVAHLTSTDSIHSFPVAALQGAMQVCGATTGAIFLYQPDTHTLQMTALILHGDIIDIATDPRAELWRAPIPVDYNPIWQGMQTQQINWLDLEQSSADAWPFALAWHQQQGHKIIPMIPLTIGDQTLGFLGLAFTTRQLPSEFLFEQSRTFAHHAALALRMTDLMQQAQKTTLLTERNRMAREIHDTLAQAFTGVIMQLEAVKRKINLTQLEAAQDHIAAARTLATEGLSEARRSVRALRPEALESQNLAAALHRLVQQMTLGTPLQASFRTEGTPHPLPSAVESHLLRIGQEALTNILKHAQAQTVRLELLFEPTAVHLQIRDDGQGFEPQSLVTQGFGLIGMQERSQQLGGQFTLVSSPGAGTEIRVSVPI